MIKEKALVEAERELLSRGGEQYTAMVFRAIEENRYYVLTHPEYMPAVKKRMDDILMGRNPSM